MTTKETFKRASTWTWNRLREGRACDHKIGEETLTDMLLLRIQKEVPSFIKVSSFTKQQEGINGADWEWWFTDTTGQWIGMLIQAKVLNHRTDRFEYLHYQSKGTKQKTKLKQHALMKNMVPAYCLFSNWSHQRGIKKSNCRCFSSNVSHFGAALAPLQAIENLDSPHTSSSPGSSNNLFSILAALTPLQCLFCTKTTPSPNNAVGINEESASSLSQALESRAFLEGIDLNTDELYRRLPPEYVSLIKEGKTDDEEFEFNIDDYVRHVVTFEIGIPPVNRELADSAIG